MSDVPAEHETLLQLMKQPGISIGVGLVALGFGGLVAAVGWLSLLPPSSPRVPPVVAEAPLKRTDERPGPANSGGMAVPEQDSTAPRLIEPAVEQLAPLRETPLPEPAPAEPQAAMAEVAAATPGPLSEPLPSSPIIDTTAPEITASAADRTTDGVGRPPSNAPRDKGYRLQLGSVRTPESARQEWERLERQNRELLGKLGYATARVNVGDRGVFYRIQAGPVADAAMADRTCTELKRRGVGCILIKP